MPTVTGPQLRKRRRAAEVTVTAIAARMGLARQTVHNLERAADPDPERVEQYTEALAALATVKVTAVEGAAS